MKAYALIAALFLLIGLWQPVLTPVRLVADGIAATFTEVPLWFIALTAIAAWAHHRLAHRPRVRVVRGSATRKA